LQRPLLKAENKGQIDKSLGWDGPPFISNKSFNRNFEVF
jgi:hypothetical protein